MVGSKNDLGELPTMRDYPPDLASSINHPLWATAKDVGRATVAAQPRPQPQSSASAGLGN
jgi:hypothetical protein